MNKTKITINLMGLTPRLWTEDAQPTEEALQAYAHSEVTVNDARMMDLWAGFAPENEKRLASVCQEYDASRLLTDVEQDQIRRVVESLNPLAKYPGLAGLVEGVGWEKLRAQGEAFLALMNGASARAFNDQWPARRPALGSVRSGTNLQPLLEEFLDQMGYLTSFWGVPTAATLELHAIALDLVEACRNSRPSSLPREVTAPLVSILIEREHTEEAQTSVEEVWVQLHNLGAQ